MSAPPAARGRGRGHVGAFSRAGVTFTSRGGAWPVAVETITTGC